MFKLPLPSIWSKVYIIKVVACLTIISFNLDTVDAQKPKAIFKKEQIEITIKSDSATVHGRYWIKACNGTKQLTIFYPFQEYHSSQVLYVKLTEVNGDERFALFESDSIEGGIRFPIEFSSSSVILIDVIYTQSVKKRSLTYILTSSIAWENPLDSATFLIKVPKNLKGFRMNYSIDKSAEYDSLVVYTIHRKKFFPVRDLIMQWN